MYRVLVLGLLLVVVILQYRLWFGEANLQEVARLRTAIEQQENDNAQLEQRNRQLEAEVLDLKRGQSALEERARSELGMIRDDETFYQLVDPVRDQPR